MRKNEMIMDFKKLNSEILKAYSKGEKNKDKIFIGVKENENSFKDFYISFGGYNLYIVPGCFFPFDIDALSEEYLRNNISVNNNLCTIADKENLEEYTTVNFEYNKPITNGHGKKIDCSIFRNDNFKIGVNNDFLKYFDLDSCTLKAKNPKSLLMVFDCYDKLLGLILPINFGQDNL